MSADTLHSHFSGVGIMSRFFIDDVYYFITVPTADHFPFFDTPDKKKIILDKINISRNRFDIQKLDFGILNDHCHYLVRFLNGETIPRFLQFINGGSSYELNKRIDNKNPVWGEYFVYVPKDEIVLQKVRGYVIGNPLKHNEVGSLKELEIYPFSSYQSNCKGVGRIQAEALVQSVIPLGEDEFIGKNLTKVS